jgi:hypothetical protein
MKQNDNLVKEYGSFSDLTTGSPLVKIKHNPTDKEYSSGIMVRFFAKKINENQITEISYENSLRINQSLYKVVSVQWKIRGPKFNVSKGSFIEKSGVTEQNLLEVDRVKKEHAIDLSSVLGNPLEYWRGI